MSHVRPRLPASFTRVKQYLDTTQAQISSPYVNTSLEWLNDEEEQATNHNHTLIHLRVSEPDQSTSSKEENESADKDYDEILEELRLRRKQYKQDTTARRLALAEARENGTIGKIIAEREKNYHETRQKFSAEKAIRDAERSALAAEALAEKTRVREAYYQAQREKQEREREEIRLAKEQREEAYLERKRLRELRAKERARLLDIPISASFRAKLLKYTSATPSETFTRLRLRIASASYSPKCAPAKPKPPARTNLRQRDAWNQLILDEVEAGALTSLDMDKIEHVLDLNEGLSDDTIEIELEKEES